MFGTLRPHGCALPQEQRQEYERFYCGLCQGLGVEHGLLSRAMLSHDAVFVALVVDGLMAQGAAGDSCRCPMMPVQIRKTVDPRSAAMRYATAVQVLLGDQWLADRGVEGPVYRRVRPLLSGHVARARRTLDALGLPLSELQGFEERQARCEVQGQTSPAAAAAPTAEALSYLFAQIAALPGLAAEASGATARAALGQLGAALGRVIYLMDALEDLRRDYLDGAFNPCLSYAADGALMISAGRVRRSQGLLRRALRELPALCQALPFQRHRDVIRNILCDRLAGRAQRAMEQARGWSDDEGRARLLRLRRQPAPLRALYGVSAALLWLWILLGSTVAAFARKAAGRGKPVHAVPPDMAQGAPDMAHGAPDMAQGAPDMARAADMARDAGAGGGGGGGGGGSGCGGCWDGCDHCFRGCGDSIQGCGHSCEGCTNNGCRGCGDCTKSCTDCTDRCTGGCGDCTKSCGDCGKPCNDCGKSCGDCTKSCGDCGKPCNDCGKSCGDCGNACNGCGDCGKGCGDCGNACNGCGDCGKGCGDCGNACNGCGDCGNSCNGCGNCGNSCNGCGNCGSCGMDVPGSHVCAGGPPGSCPT